jgi:hypothetical protein
MKQRLLNELAEKVDGRPDVGRGDTIIRLYPLLTGLRG